MMRKRLQLVLGLMIGANTLYAASNADIQSFLEAHSDSTFAGVDQKSCYVWFETNAQSYLDRYLSHADAWSRIGKPIVTARIHNVEAFTRQLVAFDSTVISGFKTSSVFEYYDYHDEAAWSQIALTARRVSELTGGNPVVLENEGAVNLLLDRGVESINREKLREAIAAQDWPEIWFWYAPGGQSEPVQSISYDIAYAVTSAMPKITLIEGSSAGYEGSPRNYISKSNLRNTLALDSNPISIVYLDDQTRNFWKLAETAQAVDAAKSDMVILYPGFGDIENSSPVLEALKDNKCVGNTYYRSSMKMQP